MKKGFKLAALMSAAAIIAIGASMTSFAKGWTQEDGEWVWLDSNGDRVTNTFKQSGSDYYWLNDDGFMGTNELVEYQNDYYYVDETGVMIKNQWKELENVDNDDDFEDTVWYYFQSSGKAYKSGKKSINGKSYIFDDRGRMLFGWIQKSDTTYTMGSSDDDSEDWKNCDYYAGEPNDGVVVQSSWKQLHVYENSTPALKTSDADTGAYDYWFYFGSTGKKYKMSDSDSATGYTVKTISSKKYAFAADGHMLTDWVDETTGAGSTTYSNPDTGVVVTKGWFKVVPTEAIDSENSEDNDNVAQWFYADNGGNLITSQIKSINGKKYLFNEKGEAQAGLFYLEFDGTQVTAIVKLSGEDATEELLDEYTIRRLGMSKEYTDGGDSKNGIYYFAEPMDTSGVMKTGSATVEIDGDSYSFKFASSGMGINGVDGSSYYVNGRKLKADSDDKFVAYVIMNYYEIADSSGKISNKSDIELIGEGLKASEIISMGPTDARFAVISSSGSIIKSGTKKDGDDYKLKVSDYILTEIDSSDSSVTEPLWTKDPSTD